MFELTESMRNFTGMTAVTVVFLIAGGVLIACNRTVDRRARNAFIGIVIALACIALADWFTHLYNGQYPEFRFLHTVLLAVTFAVAPVIPVLIASLIMPERHTTWIVVLLIAHALFQFGSIVGGYVFWVDETNTYHRGVLYPVYMAVYSLTAIYLVVESIRAGRMYQSSHIIAVFSILACMLTGVVIQVFDGTVRMTWPAVSMTVILYFMYYSDMVLRSDALTKLLNRRSYEEALAKPPLPCVVAVIDVNDFKNVNDTYGHAYGDECLFNIAQMIRRSFGNVGLCYRTGGDEFAVIMTKRLDEVDALEADLARLVADAQRNDARVPGVSIGHAIAEKDCEDIEAVFSTADRLMYQSKKSRTA